MRKKNIKDNTIQKVIDNKICCGCGACTVACPQDCVKIIFGKRFNYPSIDMNKCTNCGKCRKACPSYYLVSGVVPDRKGEGLKADYNYYLIHHNDENIRLDAASGGFISGMMIFLMESGITNGGIVARTGKINPIESISFIARTREEILDSRGSRYAPVSNCTPLRDVLKEKGKYVMIGKPCEIDALDRLIKIFPELDDKIALKISFICAGSAARESTRLFILRYLPDIDFNTVGKISYRGGGWPGFFRVFDKQGNIILKRDLLGDELDHLVPRDHYLRCHLCLDQWGQYGDISCSDPWCQEFIDNETKGRSCIVIRTRRGLDFVNDAIEKKIMTADKIAMQDCMQYQNDIVVNSEKRKSWMSAYSLFFLKKIKYPISAFKYKGKGFKTVFKAMCNSNYFEEES